MSGRCGAMKCGSKFFTLHSSLFTLKDENFSIKLWFKFH